LFDIDRFGAINHNFGPVTGDKILYQLAQFLQPSIGKSSIVGRYTGQQFLMIVLNVDTRTALKNAECWRQTIENTVFLHVDKTVRVTVSGAITVVNPSDTYLVVLERLENIIKQVKHAGPNHIFFHNGTNTAPVESHNMDIEEKEVVI
jgi:diguanylate cyclase (GGDEF)-like protein